MPAAEPGDDQRPRASPGSSDVKRTFPKPITHLHPGAARPRALRARARAAPGSPSRSPATRSSSCSSAARCSRSASTRSEPFESYFSGNTVQICPVGALTGAAYRFRSRPFDLVSTPERRASTAPRGCAHAHRPPPRHGAAPAGRRRPGGQRGVELRQGPLRVPLRHAGRPAHRRRWSATTTATLRPASWPEALRRPRRAAWPAARGAASACSPAAGSPSRTPTPTASSPGSRCGTNDIDFRARPHSRRGGRRSSRPRVAGTGLGVTYADLEAAPAVLLVGLRARGGVADRLPAAAQGRPQARTAGRSRSRRSPRRGLAQAGRHAAADRARRRGRGARRAGRRRRDGRAGAAAAARCAEPAR